MKELRWDYSTKLGMLKYTVLAIPYAKLLYFQTDF